MAPGLIPRTAGGCVLPGLAVALGLFVAACGPTGGTAPTGAGPAATSAGESAAGSGGAAVPPAQTMASDWQTTWNQTLASAQTEGHVAISGPPGEVWRRALTSFQEDYPGIEVDYTAADSRDFWPRLDQERAGGQHLWDLRVGGPDPQVFAARDSGTLDPVRPLLLLPEVTDESQWAGGFGGLFADKEKQFMPGFIAQTSYTTYLNRDVVAEADLSSDLQLLDPRWKGKISIQDPRGGAGLGTLTTMLVKYGEQYVRDLLSNQDLVVTGDNRQMTEWAIRQVYPVAVGLATQDLVDFQQQGLSSNVVGLGTPTKLSMGFGGIQLINAQPHPAAATVFINWLLSQKGQTQMATITESNSRRLDVPPGDPSSVIDPNHLQDYVEHQDESLLPQRQRASQIAQELLK